MPACLGDLMVLAIEQNTGLALKVAARGYVLETGRIVAEGTRAALFSDPQEREAYLGRS